VLETMTVTKLKLMATVLAVGLATTALALAQSGGGFGPGPQTKSVDPRIVGEQAKDVGRYFSDATKEAGVAEPDLRDRMVGHGQAGAASDEGRLQAVERKLDRILQALGAVGPEDQREATVSFQPRRKAGATDPSSPEGPYRRTLGMGLIDANGAAEKRPPLEGAADKRPLSGRLVHDLPGLQARLSRVETTLAELLARVQRLEDWAARAPASDRTDRDTTEGR
jgi:hypothetical protein